MRHSRGTDGSTTHWRAARRGLHRVRAGPAGRRSTARPTCCWAIASWRRTRRRPPQAKTYAARSRIDDRVAAPAYARRTLVNTAASWFRKKGWRNELPTSSLPEASYASDPSTRPAVIDALGQLPPRQRAVVVLRYYEDLSVAETADALGCSPGTVKSQTFEAFAKLRVLLGDAVIPETPGSPP
ncbi:sigma-70 family RNA polymerase sigma factor [Nocardioides sp. B-3]|uniref:sigma-70 family RNA polymerase sigma factor n=1 Tax=Nocardioides sp. B-3 TaxID=2895565 RepID=UPI002152033C|nr:sigma-70 family RNA polymerase sigma factor [Nocardioides sp. B-3]UUZ59981.1 sigma-70 family RNA polymerase sigma factor [Nocardioides sp. B-3]